MLGMALVMELSRFILLEAAIDRYWQSFGVCGGGPGLSPPVHAISRVLG